MFRSILSSAITLGVLAWAVPTVRVGDWLTLIFASIALSFLFGVVQPVLKILFLPINIVTLGFFSIIINVFLLGLLDFIIPGFSIAPITLFNTPLSAFWTLVFLSFVISLIQKIVKLIV